MPEELPPEVERFVVALLLDLLNRFHSDPRQAQAFEREVAMLARLAFTGADAVGQCRAKRVEGVAAQAVHDRFRLPYARGAGAARAVMQRLGITCGGTAEEYQQQAERLRRYMAQWPEEATP